MHFFSTLRSPIIAFFLTIAVGASLAGILSQVEMVDFSSAQSIPRSVQYHANGESMTLTRILGNDPGADTGNKACAKLRGSNGLPMICKNNVDSFPYLGNKGCKQFYPGANERVSTYPGHGAHGGNYDLICLAQGTRGAGGTCSQINGNTCTTCPQCAKNLDCNESLRSPSDFANGVIVRCFDAPTPPPVAPVAPAAPTAPTVGISKPPLSESADLNGVTVVKVDAGETGHSACATLGRVCVGPSLFNRDACLKIYPHANTKNAAQGPQTEYFCKGGSTTGVCAGTLNDTCMVAVSSSQQVTCDDIPSNVDAHFVECEIPFAPEIIATTGGVLPPQGQPIVSVNNEGLVQVDFTVTVHSPSKLATQIRIEWSSNGGVTWNKATLIEDSVVVSDGTADQSNSSQNQIGSQDRVDTDQFDSVSVDFVWDSDADRPRGGDAQLRVIVVDDQGNSTSDTSRSFSLDVDGEENGGTPLGQDNALDTSFMEEDQIGNTIDRVETPGRDIPERIGSNEQNASHGGAGSDSVASQRCLHGNDAGETPCTDEQQLIQYLEAIVDEVIDPDTLTEKEKALAEFIKLFNALKSDTITDLTQRLEVFGHDLTRAEAMDIIVSLLISKSAIVISDDMLDLPYSDVPYESPFAESIAIATAYGIVDGYSDGTFRPDQSPNRAEVARMLVRAASILHNRVQEVYSQEVLKLDVSLLTDWFSEYLLTFARFGIIFPTSYTELGQSVSGVAFLDYFYELLLSSGVSDPLAGY